MNVMNIYLIKRGILWSIEGLMYSGFSMEYIELRMQPLVH